MTLSRTLQIYFNNGSWNMRFLKSEADSVALSLFSVKYFIFKCFLFLCGYCGPPCNFCVLSLFSIFSPHEFLCPLSGAAVWTRLIMLAWTNNDTLMWCLLVQVTKVLLCAFQLIIISLITPPKIACSSTGCPISLGPLCFCYFLGFWSTYRGTFHSHWIAHEILIPKLTLLSILCEKLTKLQHKT